MAVADVAFKAITANIEGGSALERHLKEIEQRLGKGAHVNVGFLAGATYPAAQEEADNDSGYIVRGKNIDKRRARNVAATQTNEGGEQVALAVAQVAFWQHYGTNPTNGPPIPPRPFMSDMVRRKSPRWGHQLGVFLRKNDYDAERAMASMGEAMQGDMRQSINDWTTPPNAPRTVREKGFNKPLVDTALMLRSVDYQVLSGGEDDE